MTGLCVATQYLTSMTPFLFAPTLAYAFPYNSEKHFSSDDGNRVWKVAMDAFNLLDRMFSKVFNPIPGAHALDFTIETLKTKISEFFSNELTSFDPEKIPFYQYQICHATINDQVDTMLKEKGETFIKNAEYAITQMRSACENKLQYFTESNNFRISSEKFDDQLKIAHDDLNKCNEENSNQCRLEKHYEYPPKLFVNPNMMGTAWIATDGSLYWAVYINKWLWLDPCYSYGTLNYEIDKGKATVKTAKDFGH